MTVMNKIEEVVRKRPHQEGQDNQAERQKAETGRRLERFGTRQRIDSKVMGGWLDPQTRPIAA
jgi:hypothetical protein